MTAHSPIPVAGPWITDLEVNYVKDAAANAWYGNANMYNKRFEDAFAAYIGVRFATSLPSCTSAIHLSLAALDIGPGDEVIVPDVTWIASAAPITYVGATPVFVDIDETTWCIDAQSFEAAITANTKAVIVVDLYGGTPDMQAILEIADRHGISVIEDAAEALGSEYQGKKAGSFGHTGVFSFHGSKTLTTGEGGMLVTDDEKLFRRVLQLRDHGRPPGDRMFQNSEVAYKYKMSSLQAALGLGQIERIDQLIARKREIFSTYQSHLVGKGAFTLNAEPQGTINSYWMITVVPDPDKSWDKVRLMREMSKFNVDTRPFFSPLTSLKAYEDNLSALNAQRRNVVGYRISRSGINLPSGFNLDNDMIEYVSRAFVSIINQ